MPKISICGRKFHTIVFQVIISLIFLHQISSAQASPNAPVGTVAALKGTASVIRDGAEVMKPVLLNSPIYQRDIFKTGENSKIKLKFLDDSMVSLGANTTMRVSKYVYSPKQKKRSAFITIPEGIFRMVVSKFLPNSRFEVQTATAVSAVRGTDWMGFASESSTSIFVANGTVSIKSGNKGIEGELILTEGEGTVVKLDEVLSFKKKWGQAKVSDYVGRTTID